MRLQHGHKGRHNYQQHRLYVLNIYRTLIQQRLLVEFSCDFLPLDCLTESFTACVIIRPCIQWLPHELCCSLQTLLILATLANPSVCDLQRTKDTTRVPGSSIPSVYLSVDGILSTASFLFLASYLTPSSIMMRNEALYLTPHSLAIHVISTHYF